MIIDFYVSDIFIERDREEGEFKIVFHCAKGMNAKYLCVDINSRVSFHCFSLNTDDHATN